MEPISLILMALAAGASSGAIDALKDNAKEAAKAVYGKVQGLVRRRLAGRADGQLALERYEAAPKKWETVLSDELTEAGADKDPELLAAAKELMELLDQAGTKSGKYNVTIKDSTGVYVGDYGTQTNTFTN